MSGVRLREHGSSLLVSSLSAAFGASILSVTDALSVAIAGDEVTSGSATVRFVLSFMAWVFIAIAVYVGSIVTANTFSTIIAGRTRTIALRRLIGASARQERRAVAKEGLVVGLIGAVVGGAVGSAVAAAIITVAVATGFMDDLGYRYLQPAVLFPMAVVALTTWLASWVGSRRVLTVSPMEATGAAVEETREEAAGHRGRNAFAVVLLVVGTALLVAGVLLGLITPLGVLVGVVGGILSFTGVVLAAGLIMPPALRLVGKLFGSSAPARLAAENAVRYPERSSRTTIGLVIGVTLVTMFAVAIESYQAMIRAAQEAQPEVYAGTDEMLNVTVVVFSVLVGFSALIAAAGMVNNLSLSVLQRSRELGLLRALGFSKQQVRRMILAESAQLTLASVLVGLVLGTFYGWAGAQSVLGSISGSPGLIVPAVPVVLLATVLVGASLLTLGASLAPSRRATRVSPVSALAID